MILLICIAWDTLKAAIGPPAGFDHNLSNLDLWPLNQSSEWAPVRAQQLQNHAFLENHFNIESGHRVFQPNIAWSFLVLALMGCKSVAYMSEKIQASPQKQRKLVWPRVTLPWDCTLYVLIQMWMKVCMTIFVGRCYWDKWRSYLRIKYQSW